MASAPELGNNYAGFTQAAVDTLLPGFGGKFISIALIFFVFTTIMAYYFYCESAIIYLCRGKNDGKAEKIIIFLMRASILGAVMFGALKEADVIWQIGDIGVGICAWINVIAILLLSPKVYSALRDYEKNK